MNWTTDPGDRIQILDAAINNEPEAQRVILEYFEAYINTLSTVTFFTNAGHRHTHLDEDIKIQIQAALLRAIRHFELEEILQRHPRTHKRHGAHPQLAIGLSIENENAVGEKP